MSFINSIFVDAMVADNNDELLEKINQLQKSIDELKKQSN
jgi:voltage-gated sodium channel